MNYQYEAIAIDKPEVSLDDMETVFNGIYKTQRWGLGENYGDGSGSGSEPQFAEDWLRYLSNFVHVYRPNTVHDFGCGSYHLMKDFEWADCVDYIGYDISDIALERARKNGPDMTFEKLQNFHNLPGGDVVIVKDVLQHWHHNMRVEFLESVLQKYKIILIQGDLEANVPPNFTEYLYNFNRYNHPCISGIEVAIWLLKGK